MHILNNGDIDLYWNTVIEEFWEQANRPWLENAIARGDDFRFVSNPLDETNIFRKDSSGNWVYDSDGNRIKTIFGREYDLLQANGYTLNLDGTLVQN
jgi:hypothetical protein